MSPARKTTLRDIAGELGISISQASRALNRKPDVAPEIRAKVLALANQRNYRNISGKHTKTIGVLVPWMSASLVPYFNQLIVQTKARNLQLLFIPPNGLGLLDSQLIDGAVTIDSRIPSEWSSWYNIPLVVVNHFGWALDNICSVFPDADGESRLVMEHLIQLGHRKIARLRRTAATERELNRGLGEFYRIADQYGIRESVRNLCLEGDAEFEQALRHLLAEGFTAFIIIPMEWTALSMKIIHDSGKEIPRDVSLITYEESSFSLFQTPPLTTLAFDYPELVRNALDQLHLEMCGQNGKSQIIVPTKLLVRGSTGLCPQ